MLEGTPFGSKKQILIVDDDEDIVAAVKLILEKEGYLTATAKDGEEGLSRARLEPFDLILLDLKMPKVSGQEFVNDAARLKMKVPIIIITAQALPSITYQALRAKYPKLDLLPKPFLPNELLEKVEKYVQT